MRLGKLVLLCLRRARTIRARDRQHFGAILRIFNPYWNIAFIALVQMNYVIAPPWPLRR